MSILTGTFTALVTPFTLRGESVDYDSLGKLIDFQLSAGVHGLVVCGSTGEAATLSEEEYRAVASFTVKRVAGKVPVVGGIGANDTVRACANAKVLEGCGVDFAMVVVPPYNKPSQEGMIAHFEKIKQNTRLPLIAYNVPGRTGSNLLPSTVHRLAQQETIIGLKEACGSLDQVIDILALERNRLPVLSGDDSLTFSIMAAGGRGVISVVSNVAPEIMVTLTNAATRGEWEKARNALYIMLPLARALFVESNPVPVKCALALRGVIATPTVRLPLLNAQLSTQEKLSTLLSSRSLQ